MYQNARQWMLTSTVIGKKNNGHKQAKRNLLAPVQQKM